MSIPSLVAACAFAAIALTPWASALGEAPEDRCPLAEGAVPARNVARLPDSPTHPGCGAGTAGGVASVLFLTAHGILA